MITHRIKVRDCYWDAIERGDKNFEVRRDDRGYQKGDVLELVKTDEKGFFVRYGAQEQILTRAITYILTGGQWGIEPGYVVMGLAEIEESGDRVVVLSPDMVEALRERGFRLDDETETVFVP